MPIQATGDHKTRVLHIIDSLALGGGESVAVNICNHLPKDRYEVHLCATREDGPLLSRLEQTVRYVALRRRSRFDIAAVIRLQKYIQQERVEIIHAHSSSLFIGLFVSQFPPRPRIVWHDHFGRYRTEKRPTMLFGTTLRLVDGVISVNEALASWACDTLHLPLAKVWYIPNFVPPYSQPTVPSDLPGTPGKRIVCVANMRPQKDHVNLVSAMEIVASQEPEAHLLLVGNVQEYREYTEEVLDAVAKKNLQEKVSILGQRADGQAIVAACDIGVLSSSSEGLPLALLEYGLLGRAVVVTDVGQCSEVIAYGKYGILVQPGNSTQLANAILELLGNDSERHLLGLQLQRHVRASYGVQKGIEQVENVYRAILGTNQYSTT